MILTFKCGNFDTMTWTTFMTLLHKTKHTFYTKYTFKHNQINNLWLSKKKLPSKQTFSNNNNNNVNNTFWDSKKNDDCEAKILSLDKFSGMSVCQHQKKKKIVKKKREIWQHPITQCTLDTITDTY